MKVLCRLNSFFDILDDILLSRLKKYNLFHDSEIDVVVGNEYMVYGDVC